MAFFISRLKQWLGYENLTNIDLNAEYNNLIQKAGADTLSGANSTNGTTPTVAAMQAQESPGAVGSEVLSQTVQEDIKQLRYQLNQIIGGAQWYSGPVQSISSLNSLVNGISYVPSNRIVSGRQSASDQPMFLVPGGSTDTITLKATAKNLSTFINGTNYVFQADASISSLTLAPAAQNTCTVNDASLTGQQSSKAQGERGTVITISSIGTNITAINGQYAAFKHGAEYFIAEVDTSNNRLKNAWRGVGFDQSDNWLARTTITNADTITLMKLAWVFGLNTGALDVTYNKPTVSYVAPTSPAIGDYWQDLSVSQWKKYSGTTWVNQSAVMLGLCIQDTAHCVCARSFDFFRGYSILNDMRVEYVDATDVRSNPVGAKVSVYGTVFSFDFDTVKWNTTTQLDTGVSLAPSTTYWLYVTDLGDRSLTDVQPFERLDLLGHYHPAKPWRCVGEFATDGSSNVVSSSVLYDRYHQVGPTDGLITTRGISATAGILPTQLSNGTANQILATNGAGTAAGWVSQITRSNLPTVGQQVSSAISNSTASTSYADTGLTVTITTTGRPVFIGFTGGTGSTSVGFSAVTTASINEAWASFAIVRGSTVISEMAAATVFTTTGTGVQVSIPPGSISTLDVVAAGTYTYKLQAKAPVGNTTVSWTDVVMYAFEF